MQAWWLLRTSVRKYFDDLLEWPTVKYAQALNRRSLPWWQNGCRNSFETIDSAAISRKCVRNILCYASQIVALANLLPEDKQVDELDSYMFQTVSYSIYIV